MSMINQNPTQYVANPRLQSLYRSLEAMNAAMIDLGISDSARILRMRLFAESVLKDRPENHPRVEIVGAAKQPTPRTRNEGQLLPAGVTRSRNRFMGQIVIARKNIYLGTFSTAEEAHEAFKRAHVDQYGPESKYFVAEEVAA